MPTVRSGSRALHGSNRVRSQRRRAGARDIGVCLCALRDVPRQSGEAARGKRQGHTHAMAGRPSVCALCWAALWVCEVTPVRGEVQGALDTPVPEGSTVAFHAVHIRMIDRTATGASNPMWRGSRGCSGGLLARCRGSTL